MAVRSGANWAERLLFGFRQQQINFKHNEQYVGAVTVNITAKIERTVCSPAGSGERRGAWMIAAAAPLVMGSVMAVTQTAPGLGAALAAFNAAVLVLLLMVTSYTDSQWKKIPNWATYTAMVWALGVNLIASLTMSEAAFAATSALVPPIGIEASLTGAAVCFAAMLVLFRVAGSGAGDVKLAAVLGALLGFEKGLVIILWCHIVAGTVMAGWLIWQIGPWKLATTLLQHIGSVILPGRISKPGRGEQKVLMHRVPLAAFFAAGTIISYYYGLPL